MSIESKFDSAAYSKNVIVFNKAVSLGIRSSRGRGGGGGGAGGEGGGGGGELEEGGGGEGGGGE